MPDRVRRVTRPIVIAATVFAATAFADNAPESSKADDRLDRLERIDVIATRSEATLDLDARSSTATRLDLPVKKLPVSIDIVQQDQLRARGSRTVVEAIASSTGTTGASRAGAPGVYSVRGFTENAVSLLFDGIRVGATTVVTRPYDAFNFERIEVLRGPAAAIHGDSAVGGAINYVRRKPRVGAEESELLASAGSHSALRGGFATRGAAGARSAFVLSAAASSADSFVRDYTAKQQQIVLGLVTEPNDDLELLLEGDYWRGDTDDAYWGTPLVDGRIDERLRRVNYNVAPDNRYEDSTAWLRGVADYGLSGWQVQSQVFAYAADRDWRNFAAPRFNPSAPPSVTIREVERLEYDNELHGVRHTMARTFGRIDLLVGLEYSRSEFDSPRRQAGPANIVVDAFRPRVLRFADFDGPLNRLRYSVVDTRALFLETAAELGSAWLLHAAYRREWLDVQTRFGQPAQALLRGARDYDSDSYRLGLTWSLGDDAHLYASVGDGSEPVDGSAFAFISPATLASTELTSARQWEIGSKQRFADLGLELTAAWYDIERNDVLTADPVNPIGPRFQIGAQSSRGVELAAAWAVAPSVDLSANVAWLDAEYDNYVAPTGLVATGKRPRMVPERVYNLGLAWRARPGLALHAYLRHVGETFLTDDNAIELPDYTTIDLFARYRLDERSTIGLGVRNASDETYADWGIQFLGARVVNLAPERSVELSYERAF